MFQRREELGEDPMNDELDIDRETIESPPDGPTHMKGMVAGVRAGDFIYFSAIRGRDPVTKTFSDDTQVQARHAFDALEALLKHRGLTLRHVVKVMLYMNDLEYRDLIHEVWMEYFPVDPPARTAFQVVNASASPKANAHFVLDVIALAK
jgi:2-iminobutanoate/2-iminopropanoate deaminase